MKQLNIRIEKKEWNIINKKEFLDIFTWCIKNLVDWFYVIGINKWTKPRSKAQNRFFHWPFIEDLALKLWCNAKEAKKEVKFECLAKTFIWLDWNKKYETQSTKELTTKEFEEFIERIRLWCRENYWYELVYPWPDYNDLYSEYNEI